MGIDKFLDGGGSSNALGREADLRMHRENKRYHEIQKLQQAIQDIDSFWEVIEEIKERLGGVDPLASFLTSELGGIAEGISSERFAENFHTIMLCISVMHVGSI